jgi:tRNA threonylcarbamoyladenosine biosynthesis protein TsaB
MLTLALDSTALLASAALSRDGVPLAQDSLLSPHSHSTVLLPMVEQIMRFADVSLGEIDLFACAKGPGSFTGVRIGAATLKGLAFGRNKPCVGVSSLLAMAYGMRYADGIVCPLIGARRGRYYTALFRIRDGAVERLSEDGILPADGLDAALAPYDEPIRLTGDGYESALPFVTHPRLTATPPCWRSPGAFAVAEAAEAILRAAPDPSVFTPEALTVSYLRKTQAERERDERLSANAEE